MSRYMIPSMIKEGTRALLSIFYPTTCSLCAILIEEKEVLCAECHARFLPLSSLEISYSASASLTVFAAGKYEGFFKKLVIQKMYSNRRASRDLAFLMISHVSIPPSLKIDYCVPIPLHWTRFMKRGFNQAEIIAHHVAAYHAIALAPALKRIKRSSYQFKLKSFERSGNVKGAFEIKKVYRKSFENKTVALIDDVCTTGETLKEAARLLHAAGAKKIIALVAART